jgi:hypothetical protein
VSTDDIEAVGASVLAVVERLRTAGVSSEVWAVFSQRGGATRYQLRVRVQEAGRPVDLDRLAFWLTHPAALRRIAFAIEEMEPTEVVNAVGFKRGGNYGFPETDPDLEFFDEYAPATRHAVAGWLTEVLSRRAR